MRSLAILLLTCSAALAQQQPQNMTLTPEDQKVFREVCRMAMQNQSQPTDGVFNVATWCIVKFQQVTAPQPPPQEPSK